VYQKNDFMSMKKIKEASTFDIAQAYDFIYTENGY
jgi:hypothetical protein